MTHTDKRQKRPQASLDELDSTVLKTVLVKGGKVRKVTLRDVFNHLSNKRLNDNAISKKDPDISHNDIKAARSILISKFPGLYADHVEGWPATVHHFLIDENLSKLFAISLWHAFGRATHTEHADLNGAKDPQVWRWAIKNKIKAIVTRDKRMINAKEDLGLIAVKNAYDLLHRETPRRCKLKAEDLPLLIQIEAEHSESVSEILEKHKETILNHLENRTVPYILLTKEQCVIGPTYEDIEKYDWFVIKGMIASIDKSAKEARQQKNSSASPS